MQKTTYYLFGIIPLWTVVVTTDEDALYDRLSKRFTDDLNTTLNRVRAGK